MHLHLVAGCGCWYFVITRCALFATLLGEG